MDASPLPTTPAKRYPRLKIFGLGLLVRLVGLALIWIGDGHSGIGWKALVVIGIILSIGGIGILKWLSFQRRPKKAA